MENLLVALSVWLTAMPSHVKGNFVYYGPQYLIEANAEYRGYDLSFYRDRCGLSAISPADLGKIVWIKMSDGSFYGPCLFVDVGAWQDFYTLVYIRDGELSVSLCPPGKRSRPEVYQPPLEWSNGPVYSVSNYPYPKQQMPMECKFGRQGLFVK